MESSTETLRSSSDTSASSSMSGSATSDVSMEDVYGSGGGGASDSYRTDADSSPTSTITAATTAAGAAADPAGEAASSTLRDYSEHALGTARQSAQRKLTQLRHLGRIVESQYEKRARRVREFLQTRVGSVDDNDVLPEGTLELAGTPKRVLELLADRPIRFNDAWLLFFKVENVRLVDRFNSRKPAVGTLYLTTTHLIFVEPSGKKETWILHMHISSVEKLPLTTAGSPLLIRCKTFLCVTFIIPRERECHDIYTSLLKLSQPAELEELYAFHYTAPDISDRLQGWDLFDVQSEYLRMGVPNSNWVLTNINEDYELCDTYPRYMFTPATANTHILLGSARFRSRGRLPVLSYLHRASEAAICRSSQPLSGFSARCMEDEAMLQAILKSNPRSKFMYVVDTRPKINAMANKAAGKGYENENFYTNIKFQFLGIENIHVMRSSLQKLMDVCELKNPSMNAFLSGLEGSGYLKHVKSIMDTSVFIAKAINDGVSVMVHCSDGWDRTAQVCSLASLMLDPYYRTIQGFMALIEKEWLSFGHKFTDRCGFIETVDSKETSPVFTQFLDCVYQLTTQFPYSFEFNERFLLTLHDHVYSCQFGTFIGNCEKDRIDLRLRERTYSLWGYMAKYTNDYINPFYRKEHNLTNPCTIPVNNAQATVFWRGLYNRFENGVHPRESIFDNVCALKDHTHSMEEHIKLLEKRLTSLCKLLNKPEEQLRRYLQGMTTSESMDLGALLLTESNNQKGVTTGTLPAHPTRGHGTHESHLALDMENSNHRGGTTRESDNESGFEDCSSQMSKSLNDEVTTASTTAAPQSLMSSSISLETLCLESLVTELKSVAVEWKTFRSVRVCSCAMPFEHFTKKYHCWRCGDVFCTRCIDRLMPLPGHMSQSPVPVCKACYKELKHSPSPSLQDLQVSQQQQQQTTAPAAT